MNKKTSNIFRIVVAVIFLVLGAVGVYNSITGLIRTVAAGNAIAFGNVWGMAFDVVMVTAGLLALMKVRKSVCVVLAVILFVGFAVEFVTGLFANSGIWNVAFSAAKAVCSFLFIGCVDSTSSNRKR